MRRYLYVLLAAVLGLAILGACATPTPQVVKETVVVTKEVEKVVKETVVVTKEVEKVVTKEVEKVVEKVVTPTPVDYGKVVILSTQAKPVEEAEKMRGIVLKDFPGQPEFIPEDEGVLIDRVLAEKKAGKGSVDVIIALHGTFPVLLKEEALSDLTPLMERLSDRGIPKAFVDLGKLGTDTQYYVPVMQATYIFAANKKALEYLPEGADINALTWDELLQWAKNIYEATGEKKLGFPAGEKGLMHRFLEGYIYPSFTGGMVTNFRTDDAVAMWEFFKELWQYVNPQSVTYEFMQEPLLAEEVWVAFDHTARLINAFKERPDDFVAFPAPAGPKGRGFMPVIVGAGIPTTAPNRTGAEAMIDYLTQPDTQITILREIGFFPVTDVDFPAYVSVGIRLEGEAVSKQAAAPDALPALLPVGLGARGGEFNKIYRDTFTRIVLNGEDIRTVLDEEAALLQEILNDTGAPCWPPDPPSEGACQVK